MGFPGGYTDVILPKQLINILSLLSFIRTFTLTLLGCVGLSGLLEHRPDNSTRPEPVLIRPESASANLIREMIPAETVSFGPGRAEEESCCAVCLYEYEEGEEIRRMRNCCHVFHKCCVDRWIDHDKDTCPLCRKPFIPTELEEEFNDKLWAVYGISDYAQHVANFF